MLRNTKTFVRQILGSEFYGSLALTRRRLEFVLWASKSEGRTHIERLKRLKNAHRGRRAFVIGNGPSLAQTDVLLLRNEITIGSNGIFLLTNRTGFVPTYYTIEDRLVAEDRSAQAAAFQGPVKLFPHDLCKHLRQVSDATYFFFDRSSKWQFPPFGSDLSVGCQWGGTVTYLNLQLAVHLGCNPIYLIGVDHSYTDSFKIDKSGSVWTSQEDDQNHFDPSYFGKGYRWHDPQVDRMERSYHSALAYAQRNKIEIFNATFGGKLEVFARKDYSTLF